MIISLSWPLSSPQYSTLPSPMRIGPEEYGGLDDSGEPSGLELLYLATPSCSCLLISLFRIGADCGP